MSRTDEQESARTARKVITREIAVALALYYWGNAKVNHYETNTGLEQVSVDFGDGVLYHLTITKARS